MVSDTNKPASLSNGLQFSQGARFEPGHDFFAEQPDGFEIIGLVCADHFEQRQVHAGIDEFLQNLQALVRRTRDHVESPLDVVVDEVRDVILGAGRDRGRHRG